MNEKLTVRQVVDQAVEAMLAMGQSPNTVWRAFYPRCTRLIRFYEQHQMEFYDPELTRAYTAMLYAKFHAGELSRQNYLNYLKTAERVDQMFLTGRIEWSCKSRHKREPLPSDFEYWHQKYLNANTFHPNTREDISWVIYKHLSWLLEQGYTDFSTMTEDVLGKYISFCAGTLSPGGVRNTLSYLRKFYDFLQINQAISINYMGFLAVSVHRPEKIQPAATQEGLEKILAQINRSTPIGKRDYAMILLGARLGLRADDIVRMKLDEIDWQAGQIKLLQQKTRRSLLLPLPAEVGEAMKEYILHARPKNDFPHIFLRAQAPFQPLNAGSAVGYTYAKYQQKAGIERRPFDGKGFHSLRRMLAKDMTVAGIPVTTTAQIQGHSNLNTVKQYISLDTVHLKECALDFRGIEVAGGVF